MILSSPCQSHRDGNSCIINILHTQAPFPFCSFESFHLSIIECGWEAESTQDTVGRQGLSWKQALYLPLTLGLLPGIALPPLPHSGFLFVCLLWYDEKYSHLLPRWMCFLQTKQGRVQKKQRDSNFNLQFPSVLPSVLLGLEGKNTAVEWRQHVLRPLGLKLYFPWETGPLWETWPPHHAPTSNLPRSRSHQGNTTLTLLWPPVFSTVLRERERMRKHQRVRVSSSPPLPSPPSGGSLLSPPPRLSFRETSCSLPSAGLCFPYHSSSHTFACSVMWPPNPTFKEDFHSSSFIFSFLYCQTPPRAQKSLMTYVLSDFFLQKWFCQWIEVGEWGLSRVQGELWICQS